MRTLEKLASLLFACRHTRVSRPRVFTSRPGEPRGTPSGYVVCLDCGAKLSYDFDKMAIGEPLKSVPPPR